MLFFSPLSSLALPGVVMLVRGLLSEMVEKLCVRTYAFAARLVLPLFDANAIARPPSLDGCVRRSCCCAADAVVDANAAAAAARIGNFPYDGGDS